MNGSLGHFKGILQRKKARKEKSEGRFDKKKLNYKQTGGEKLEFNAPKLRTSELERLKSNIRSKIKKDNLNDYLLFGGIFLVLFSILYYFIKGHDNLSIV